MNIQSQQHVKNSDTLRTMTNNLRIGGLVLVIFVGVFAWRKMSPSQQKELGAAYQQAEQVADLALGGSATTILVNLALGYKAKSKVRGSGKYYSDDDDHSLPNASEAGVLITVPKAKAGLVNQVLTRAEGSGGVEHLLELMDEDLVRKKTPFAHQIRGVVSDAARTPQELTDQGFSAQYVTEPLRDGVDFPPMEEPTPVIDTQEHDLKYYNSLFGESQE